MLNIVYEVNGDGYIIEYHVYEVDEHSVPIEPLSDNYIHIKLPDGFYKPKWNGTEWTEGATQQEIEELTRVEPSPPTAEERITMLEDTINFLLGL